MDVTIEQIAEAFSRHRFAEAYPHLAPEVRWVLVGGPTLVGSAAVIAACEESNAYLSRGTTTFRSFRTIVGAGTVVVDSLAEYVGAEEGAEETSVVASCDIYDFEHGVLTGITSYTVEVSAA